MHINIYAVAKYGFIMYFSGSILQTEKIPITYYPSANIKYLRVLWRYMQMLHAVLTFTKAVAAAVAFL